MEGNNETLVLARKIAEGTATREERGITLKTLSTQLAIELVSNLDDVRDYIEQVKAVKKSLTDKFKAKLDEAIELDELDLEDMYKYLTGIVNDELKIIEAYRKLLQGGQLFSEDSLSEEDRIILRILRSFSTNDEKREFYEAIAQYMARKNISIDDINS